MKQIHQIKCYFQDHRLGCGKLHREISIKVCNPLFKDYQLVVTPFTEITLVQMEATKRQDMQGQGFLS